MQVRLPGLYRLFLGMRFRPSSAFNSRSTEGREGDSARPCTNHAACVCGCFCPASSGNDGIENSTAYFQSWLMALKNDKGMAVIAASQAQRAADCILGISQTDRSETEQQGQLKHPSCDVSAG